MRAPASLVILFLALIAPATAATADVVIQAGHEGRPASCAALLTKTCLLGAGTNPRERDWTPIVADAAAAALRHDGFTVIRRPADYRDHDTARAAIFVHFDGSAPACGSGSSVGFPPSTSQSFVRAWERRYRALFPFRFVGENFTIHEAHYYGFRKVDAPGKALLIEFGEITCPAQRAWLAPRLHLLGTTVAAFLRTQLQP